MTRQAVERILRGYPSDRKQPSVWQTTRMSRPAYGWAITFYDQYARQVTCFGSDRAEQVAAEHREAARYAAAERKPAFVLRRAA